MRSRFYLAALGVTLAVAGIVSFYASGSPDGLEYVAGQQGFGETAEISPTADSALADYGVAGVANERLSIALAGLLGVAVVLLCTWALLSWSRRGRRPAEQ